MTRILFVGVAAFTLIAGAARAESPAAAAPARSSNAMAECPMNIPGAKADLQHLQSAVRVRAERMQQHGCGSRTQR